MPFKKYANASLNEPVLKPGDWEKMHGKHAFHGCQIDGDHPFCKSASAKKEAAFSRYLLSHCTIMSSVAVEDEPFDFLIRPASSAMVNNNDDAWTSAVLKLSYKSFIGAFSFVEHFQNSRFAKGHILDAVLRRITLDGAEDPTRDWVYFCDILVATDLTHEKLVDDIRNGAVRYLSMGCVTDLVICSYCGAHVTDANTYCSHLQFQKGTFLADDNGVPRRIAELCGHKTMPNGGVKFIEASWVATPAFAGATKRSIVAENWEGPKTPYTQAVQGNLAKVASVSETDLADTLLGFDLYTKR